MNRILIKAKKNFLNAHTDYHEYLELFGCGENLALYTSATLRNLGMRMFDRLSDVITVEEELNGTAPKFLYQKLEEFKERFQIPPPQV